MVPLDLGQNNLMLRNYYINKEWIMSATARRIYRISAIVSLALPIILFMMLYSGEFSPGWVPLLRNLTPLCIVAAAITIVAMEYFLFGFDRSSETKKVFWFCLMLVPLLGSALYCLTVYSRATGANNLAPVAAEAIKS
jgi:hypothetical protein